MLSLHMVSQQVTRIFDMNVAFLLCLCVQPSVSCIECSLLLAIFDDETFLMYDWLGCRQLVPCSVEIHIKLA